MSRTRRSPCIVTALLAACQYGDFDRPPACGAQPDGRGCDIFRAEEWDVIEGLSIGLEAPPPPPSPGNRWADDERAAALGQKLFFDKCFAHTNPTKPEPRVDNCAGCHRPDAWMQENLDEEDKTRNTPSIIDAAFYDWWPWDGRRDSLWAMALIPVEGDPLASDPLNVARRVHAVYGDEYRALFCREDPVNWGMSTAHCETDVAAIEGEWGMPGEAGEGSDWHLLSSWERTAINRTYANVGKALEAYMRLFISGPTPFDEFVDGDPDAIDDSAKRGLKLFVGRANCIACHDGPTLSDDEFHVIGLPPNDHVVLGRFDAIEQVKDHEFNSASVFSDDPDNTKLDGLAAEDTDRGAFRTKHLRGVAMTGRYMHAGQLGTLEDVVHYYADRGDDVSLRGAILDESLDDIDLSDDDVADLVAFLESLTFEPISPYMFGTEAEMDELPDCDTGS